MAVAHPAELTELDLYEVWAGVDDLTARFDPFRYEERMAHKTCLDVVVRRSRTSTRRRTPRWN